MTGLFDLFSRHLPRARQADLRSDPARDPELAAWLRSEDAAQALGGLPEDFLRARLVASARPRLARLAAGRTVWWEWAASWARLAIPLAAAAGLATIAFLTQPSSTENGAAEPVALMAVTVPVESRPAVLDEFVGAPNSEWLYLATFEGSGRSTAR